MRFELQRIKHEKDGFVIGKAIVKDGAESGQVVSVKGNFPGAPETSLWYEADARREHHPRYGEQFTLRNVIEVQPESGNGLLRYLQRAGIPFNVAVGLLNQGESDIMERAKDAECLRSAGATDEQIQDIIGKLTGFNWWEALSKVAGFGEKRLKNLSEWEIETGQSLDDILQDNPYQLLDAPGIGWSLADEAARTLGMAQDDLRRLAAAPEYVLSKNEKDGHTWMPTGEMLKKTSEMLGLPSHQIVDAIMNPDIYTPVVMDSERAWRAETHKAERGLAWGLKRIMGYSPLTEKINAVLDEGAIFRGLPFDISQEQREAIAHACQNKVSVLTGGAGTGKSTITKIVVDAFVQAAGKDSVVLCSPTGKAAKRLSETTGQMARTIHSTIHGKKIESTTQLVVVDEASMLDTFVAEWLLREVPYDAHVLFIGDDNQLPSVGAGRVLFDLQLAGVPTFRLQKTHRNKGAILDVVYGVLSGSVPQIHNNTDVFLFEVPDADNIPALVCRVVSQEKDTESIKVIAPQRSRNNGEGCGWNTLNRHLQDLLNPAQEGKKETRWFGDVLREGDRLLWTENNKDLGLVNGDDVSVVSIDGETIKTIKLDNGKSVPMSDLTAVHGYANTTHKAQGSEYDVVIFVCHSSHRYMLTRRQVYTALSRAKKRLYIIGEQDALNKASRSLRDTERNTHLVQFLNEE